MINLAFFVASWFVYGLLDYADLPGRNFYLIIFINLNWAGVSIFLKAYRWYERIRIEDQFKLIARSCIAFLAFNTLFYYHFLHATPHTSFLLVAHALTFVFLCVGRSFNRLREVSPYEQVRYAIVGGRPENIAHLFKAFDYCFPGSSELVGHFGQESLDNVRRLGGYADIKEYLLTDPAIDKLIIFDSSLGIREEREIIQLCQARLISVEVAPRETRLYPRSYVAHRLGDLTVFRLKEEPLSLLRNKILKRTMDLVISTLVIVFLLTWMIPLIGLLIYLESPGPIFFIQERSGYRNKVFRMIKFRTMTHNNAGANTTQAKKHDSRVTRIGSILRKTSLDEFPQFINVWLGQMSVVGPRPHMIEHTQEYAAKIDRYMIRHLAKPGITGLAQIKGYRGGTEELYKMEKRVEFDVWYLEQWSIFMDFRCIIFTVINIFRGEENAY